MSEVKSYYERNAAAEWRRGQDHRMEFAVSLALIRERLSADPMSIADIGGGPGRYSLPLAEQGHAVHLIDLAPANITKAKSLAAESGIELSATLAADARDLSDLPDGIFDAALLMGPLYHLFSQEDRDTAIAEALRILRPGGLFCAALVCRFTPYRYAAKGHPRTLVLIREFWESFEQDGELPGNEDMAPMHLAHPDDVTPTMERHGIETDGLFGCESVLAGVEERVNELDGEEWDAWVELCVRLSKEQSLLGNSEHLLYIGRKPE